MEAIVDDPTCPDIDEPGVIRVRLCKLLWSDIRLGAAEPARLVNSVLPGQSKDGRRAKVSDFDLTSGVEKQILRFDIAMSDTLTVEVTDAVENLLKRALDLCSRHASLANRIVQISTGTIFHDFAPFPLLVLHEIDRLDDVWMPQGGRNAKFRREFLDIVALRLFAATRSEFLYCIQLVFSSIPFMGESYDTRSALANCHLTIDAILAFELGTLTGSGATLDGTALSGTDRLFGAGTVASGQLGTAGEEIFE